MVWTICKFRHYLVAPRLRYTRTTTPYSGWVPWRPSTAPGNIVGGPGKSQTHIDAFSRLPTGAVDDDWDTGIRAIGELLQYELRQINKAKQRGTPVKKNVVSLNGCSIDAKGRTLVGPRVTQHMAADSIPYNVTSFGHIRREILFQPAAPLQFWSQPEPWALQLYHPLLQSSLQQWAWHIK